MLPANVRDGCQFFIQVRHGGRMHISMIRRARRAFARRKLLTATVVAGAVPVLVASQAVPAGAASPGPTPPRPRPPPPSPPPGPPPAAEPPHTHTPTSQ